jgi:hypothetical protein
MHTHTQVRVGKKPEKSEKDFHRALGIPGRCSP